MRRLCPTFIVLLLALTQVTAGQDGDKKKPPDKKKQPIVCTIELKDGTTLTGNYLSPSEVTIDNADIGPLKFKIETVRFLDCEGVKHRLSTYRFDTILGKLETEEFTFKVLSTNADTTFPREKIKRIHFPDPPRAVPTLK